MLPHFFTLPNLIVFAFVITLFVVAFRACFKSTRGNDSMDTLLLHLQAQSGNFENANLPDPASERATLERLLNRAKVANTGAAISANDKLRQAFTHSYKLVSDKANLPAQRNEPHWTQLSLVMRNFYESYFATSLASV